MDATHEEARREQTVKNRISGLILSVPAMLLVAAFFVAPLLLMVVSSFLDFDIRMRYTWAGLTNFGKLLQSTATMFNTTLLFGLGVAILTMALAFIGGLALSQFPGRWWVLFQISGMFAGVTTFMLWLWMFSPFSQGANELLAWFGVAPIAWHSTPWAAKLAVLIVILCWNFPGNMYTIAMCARAVPKELLEAARIEGASEWQEFWNVTLPVIRRPVTLMAVNLLAATMLVYEAPTLLWRGGPLGATTTVLMKAVEWAHTPGEYGMAAAVSVVLVITSAPLCLVAWKYGNREQ